MKRIRKTLITGLLLLGVSSVQASPFSALQNNLITTTLLKKVKNNVLISSVIGMGAILCTAYGICKVFFKDKPISMSKLTAAEQNKENGWQEIYSYKSELESLENIKKYAEDNGIRLLLNALGDFGSDVQNTGTKEEKSFLKWINGVSQNYPGMIDTYTWAYAHNRIDVMEQIACEVIGDYKKRIQRNQQL